MSTRSIARFGLFSCLLGGCAAKAGEPAAVPKPAPAAAAPTDCAPIDGIDAVVDARGMVVFGEMHGTVESPRAFGEAVCHVVARHGRAVVALEIPVAEQTRIDEFLDGSGGDIERALLLRGAHWVDDFQDGRRSVAMVELLDRLRVMRAEGARIAVVAFDARALDPKSDAEQQLADSLASARERHRDAPFLVLVGNVHPRTNTGAPWDPKFSPMGRRLVERGVDILPIDLRFSGGSAWACTGNEPKSCGTMQLASTASAAESPRLELFEAPDETGYRGALLLGPVTASPPALTAVTED